MSSLKSWLAAACAFTCVYSQAGQASGSFTVMVRPAGICISTSLSQQTHAIVKVTCSGEHFVSIEPRAGSQFLGVHGGAWRFHLSGSSSVPQFLMSNGEFLNGIGMGTVTAMRVLGLEESDKRLELLVSF